MVLMPRQTFQAKNLVSRNNRALSEFSYWILKDIFHKFYLFLYITSSDRNKWRKELRILREPHVETRLIQRTPWIYCCGEVRPNMLILNSLANEARSVQYLFLSQWWPKNPVVFGLLWFLLFIFERRLLFCFSFFYNFLFLLFLHSSINLGSSLEKF